MAFAAILINKHQREIEVDGEIYVQARHVPEVLGWKRTKGFTEGNAKACNIRGIYVFAEKKGKYDNYRQFYALKSDLERYVSGKSSDANSTLMISRDTLNRIIDERVEERLSQHIRDLHVNASDMFGGA